MGIISWACFNILPQFVLATGILISSVGIKKALSVITKFPPILFVPMFSFWTIGPLRLSPFYKAFNGKSQKLSISFWLSWANVLLTLLGPICTLICTPNTSRSLSWKLHETLSCPILSLSILILVLIQFLDVCKNSCSPYCQSNCCPVRKFTYMNVTDMDMELTREDVEIVKSRVSFLDILLLMCGIASVTIGVIFTSPTTYSFASVTLWIEFSAIVICEGVLISAIGVLGLVNSFKTMKSLIIAYYVLNILASIVSIIMPFFLIYKFFLLCDDNFDECNENFYLILYPFIYSYMLIIFSFLCVKLPVAIIASIKAKTFLNNMNCPSTQDIEMNDVANVDQTEQTKNI